MQLKIAVLPGDGIGPEVTTEAVNILKAVGEFGGHTFTFTEALIGGVAITETGSPLPQATLDLALSSRRRPPRRRRRQQVQRAPSL